MSYGPGNTVYQNVSKWTAEQK